MSTVFEFGAPRWSAAAGVAAPGGEAGYSQKRDSTRYERQVRQLELYGDRHFSPLRM